MAIIDWRKRLETGPTAGSHPDTQQLRKALRSSLDRRFFFLPAGNEGAPAPPELPLLAQLALLLTPSTACHFLDPNDRNYAQSREEIDEMWSSLEKFCYDCSVVVSGKEDRDPRGPARAGAIDGAHASAAGVHVASASADADSAAKQARLARLIQLYSTGVENPMPLPRTELVRCSCSALVV